MKIHSYQFMAVLGMACMLIGSHADNHKNEIGIGHLVTIAPTEFGQSMIMTPTHACHSNLTADSLNLLNTSVEAMQTDIEDTAQTAPVIDVADIKAAMADHPNNSRSNVIVSRVHKKIRALFDNAAAQKIKREINHSSPLEMRAQAIQEADNTETPQEIPSRMEQNNYGRPTTSFTEKQFIKLTEIAEQRARVAEERARLAEGAMHIAEARERKAEESHNRTKQYMQKLIQQMQDTQLQATRAEQHMVQVNNSTQQFIDVQKSQVESLNVKAQSLDGATVSLKDETISLKGETQSLKGETLSLKGETQSLWGEAHSLKGETVALNDKTESLKNEADAMRQEIDVLRGTIKELRTVQESKKKTFYRSIITKLLGY